MAIALDQNLSGSQTAATATTKTLTTPAAVASNGFIVVCVMWFSTTVNLSSVTGGSLAWTIDKTLRNGSVNCALASAQAPAGLASSTIITANYSATTTSRGMAGVSFTGVATSLPVDTTSSASSGTQTAWSCGALATANANDLLVGAAMGDLSGTAGTSTPTSPFLELSDFNSGSGGDQYTFVYNIVAATGSYTPAGTWTIGSTNTGVGAAYMAAGAAAAASPRLVLPTFQGAF